MSKPRWGAAAAIVLLAALAGCGSDTNQTESTRQAAAEVKGMLGQLLGGKRGATPAREPETIAREALATQAGPVIFIAVDGTKTTTTATLKGQNGAMQSWFTAGGQAVILRDGMLAGTRGFGFDLLSADTAELAALVRGRRAGAAPLTLRYLDGLGAERALPLSCTTTKGAAQSYAFADTQWSGTQMAAHCEGLGYSFDNSYVVAASGAVVSSRQWISAQLGYLTLQSLRN